MTYNRLWIFFSAAANPPLNLTVTTSEKSSTISVSWSSPIGGDKVTGYLVYYLHPNHSATMIEKNSEDISDTFTELTTTQHVYTVSIQALSEHLPSIVVGPVTARGQLIFCPNYMLTFTCYSSPWSSSRFSGVECDREETEHLMARTSRAKWLYSELHCHCHQHQYWH